MHIVVTPRFNHILSWRIHQSPYPAARTELLSWSNIDPLPSYLSSCRYGRPHRLPSMQIRRHRAPPWSHIPVASLPVVKTSLLFVLNLATFFINRKERARSFVHLQL
ncbi:hypothetical protein BRADI_4g03041v3 [Brachypodium distachyon]|uniref:Uncharacterized protein n=1 Tax=Brachypodium distachyon TaxID=15368 RepID=A0A2K2CK70_BRADI|nr:hypothetical protein BRADI_4g03041v3 [Brachypodium distachyon]